jgi:transglutaminase superfamily protein
MRKHQWLPLWFEAYFVLLALALTHRVLGLRQLGSVLESIPADRTASEGDPLLVHLANVVSIAADWQPYRALCLHQCLALCWMLRRRGIAAELVMGVYKFPFSAHVWLECRGNVIHWRSGLSACTGTELLRSMAVIFRTGSKPQSRPSG